MYYMRFILNALSASVLLGGIALLEIQSPSVTYKNDTYAKTVVVSGVADEVQKLPVDVIINTTILFGGDVMLSRGINNVMSKHNDFTYPFQKLQDLIVGADVAVINLEGPVSTHGTNRGSIYSFRANPEALEGLVFAGIDLVTLANNHTGDYGPEALSETIELLKSAGIKIVGAGIDMTSAMSVSYIEANGLKIAFLGATPLSPAWLTRQDSAPAVAPLREQSIIDGIRDARNHGADIVAVLLHWGNEYETKHLVSQEVMAHRFVDAGATLVIGHHPHVVQEVERYNGGVIAYSLGNFIFDQNMTADTRHGLLLKVIFKGKEISSVQEIPIQFSSSYQPYVPELPL